MKFERIITDPAQMGGLPCIRGLRIPVAAVIDMVADGMSPADIIDAFPDLQPQDIEQALHYAAESVREREIPIRAASRFRLRRHHPCHLCSEQALGDPLQAWRRPPS